MEAIDQLYWWVLIIAGLGTFVYMMFSDAFEMFEGWFNPAVILSFLALGAGIGLILNALAHVSPMIGLAVALVGSLALTTLLYLFVLLPLSNAEESIGLTDEALVGRVGRLTVPIPEGGYGEVLIETVTGSLLKTAQSLDGTSISTDHRVVIIEVKGNIAIVMPYDEPTIREEI